MWGVVVPQSVWELTFYNISAPGSPPPHPMKGWGCRLLYIWWIWDAVQAHSQPCTEGVWSCLEAQSVFSQRLCSSQEFAQRAQKFFEPSFSISKGSHSNFMPLHCTGTAFCPQHNTGLSLFPAMPHSCMPCILCMCSRHVILVSPEVKGVRSNSSPPPPPPPPPPSPPPPPLYSHPPLFHVSNPRANISVDHDTNQNHLPHPVLSLPPSISTTNPSYYLHHLTTFTLLYYISSL